MKNALHLIILLALTWPSTSWAQATKRVRNPGTSTSVCISPKNATTMVDAICTDGTTTVVGGTSSTTTNAVISAVTIGANDAGSAITAAKTYGYQFKVGEGDTNGYDLVLYDLPKGSSAVERMRFSRTSGNVTITPGGTARLTLVPGSSGISTLTGPFKVSERLEVGGAGAGTFVGMYQVTLSATTGTCEAGCANADGSNALNSTSGHCLYAWHGGSFAASTCADATNETKYCLCVGLD